MIADDPKGSVLGGQVAVVTGSGRGIGRGIAHALARAGVHVAVADIDPSTADETATVLRAEGHEALVHRALGNVNAGIEIIVEGVRIGEKAPEFPASPAVLGAHDVNFQAGCGVIDLEGNIDVTAQGDIEGRFMKVFVGADQHVVPADIVIAE